MKNRSGRETVAVLEELKVARRAAEAESGGTGFGDCDPQSGGLGIRQQDFELGHEVPFLNASSMVFRGLRILLDEQTPAARRPAAVIRIREYAGLEKGYRPLTEILQESG